MSHEIHDALNAKKDAAKRLGLHFMDARHGWYPNTITPVVVMHLQVLYAGHANDGTMPEGTDLSQLFISGIETLPDTGQRVSEMLGIHMGPEDAEGMAAALLEAARRARAAGFPENV